MERRWTRWTEMGARFLRQKADRERREQLEKENGRADSEKSCDTRWHP